MKNKTYILNTLLAVVLGLALLTAQLVRAFAPLVILPQLDVPNLVLLSLAVLVLEHYLAPGADRCYICIPLLAVLTFGLLPLMAGFACQHTFWKLGLVGGIVFAVTTWMFSAMIDRLQSGPVAKLAPIVGSFGIFLAAQCFTGILL